MSAAYNWRGKVLEETQRRNSIGSSGESGMKYKESKCILRAALDPEWDKHDVSQRHGTTTSGLCAGYSGIHDVSAFTDV